MGIHQKFFPAKYFFDLFIFCPGFSRRVPNDNLAKILIHSKSENFSVVSWIFQKGFLDLTFSNTFRSPLSQNSCMLCYCKHGQCIGYMKSNVFWRNKIQQNLIWLKTKLFHLAIGIRPPGPFRRIHLFTPDFPLHFKILDYTLFWLRPWLQPP